jgi:succinylarginine dihydrolase
MEYFIEIVQYYEVNFDGLVGPSHLFSGLSYGNLASTENRGLSSNPRQAALQGLAKMRLVYDLGLKQALVPPQLRPNLSLLESNGYKGSRQEIFKSAYQANPNLFAKACSASNMWTANAATVSPSSDSADRRLHITIANLASNQHRAIESLDTYKYFKQICTADCFRVHKPVAEPDEGAANHNRLAINHGARGLEIFVYGKDASRFPARQSYEASSMIAKQHGLTDLIFAEQNPEVIDQGVFHNDVISTSNENLFLYHDESFTNSEALMIEISDKYYQLNGSKPILVRVTEADLSVHDAVSSYLFNSQIFTVGTGMILLAPFECKNNSNVKSYIEQMIQDPNNPINEVVYVDLRQSMCNGGGPACLRLRMVMSEDELAQVHQGVFLNDKLFAEIQSWIESYYSDDLTLEDMVDQNFYIKHQEALFELYDLLKLTFLD